MNKNDSLQNFINKMKGKTREEQLDLLEKDFKKAIDETREGVSPISDGTGLTRETGGNASPPKKRF